MAPFLKTQVCQELKKYVFNIFQIWLGYVPK